ncbi:putative HAD-like domain-containing protein [Rosa chinensis]|uniref:Putative HAD-like domain-containing protein n=1 Tax=Rosa chinensis TaxID=74649 RepID=A0A2P6SEB0_ROSCH|nr:putative HAD-like domain-containing protein [Rosa chinensis]
MCSYLYCKNRICIDGTLCDSDPLHYYAFREMLQEVGFNGGFLSLSNSSLRISVGCTMRSSVVLASEQLEPMKGLHKLREWIENQGLKQAAVTNPPRPNGELLVSALDLLGFFEVLVIANECDRAKPFS